MKSDTDCAITCHIKTFIGGGGGIDSYVGNSKRLLIWFQICKRSVASDRLSAHGGFDDDITLPHHADGPGHVSSLECSSQTYGLCMGLTMLLKLLAEEIPPYKFRIKIFRFNSSIEF